MHIPENEIETSKTVGHTKEGKPVVFVVTSGGLNAFFTKDDSNEIVTLGAAPHVAIARYLCEKREPGIVWNDEFLGKTESLSKSEDAEGKAFIGLRNLVWSKPLEKSETDRTGSYLLYNVIEGQIQVIEKSELIQMIKDKKATGNEVIRELTLAEPAKVLFMSEFKRYLK